jgi:ribonucleotide monophosphatase NagD (HAD superfamily)
MSGKIPPVLIDFDGVLKIGENPAPGAGDFLKFIKENNIPSIILSNSSLKTKPVMK